MAWGVADILDPQFLTTAYQKQTGIDDVNPFLDYFSVAKENVYGDTVEVTVFPAERSPAPINPLGSSARTLAERGASKAYFTPVNSYNELPIQQTTLLFLREEAAPQFQDLGRAELNRQIAYFKRRHQLLRQVVLSKTLFNGIVYTDSSGNVKESSSTGLSIDLGVAASHKNQMSSLIATKWSDASAKILTQLDNIRIAAANAGVPIPTEIWVNSSVKKWLRDNTELKAYFQTANIKNVDLVLQGDMVQIGQFNWHFFDGTYVDDTGTTRKLVPDNQACIHPKISGAGGWFRGIEGSNLVHSADGIQGADSAEAALSGDQIMYGDYVYCKKKDNPSTVVLRGGTRFLYAFADPDAIWMPTVDF